MAEEQTITASSMDTTDNHKRKLEDLEPEAPHPTSSPHIEPQDSKTGLNADEAVFAASDGSESKRFRVDDKPDVVTVGENGHQLEKVDEVVDEDVKQPILENVYLEGVPDMPKEAEGMPKEAEGMPKEAEGMPKEAHDNEDSERDNHDVVDIIPPSVEKPELEITDKPVVDEFQQPNDDVPQEEDVSLAEQHPTSETISRKMDVPNNKVGVLIGKAGDTIRMLQYNSGAKIQIMRDLDADPHAPTRPVELTGSLENINKAEKLIKDVIAEADAGGSPSLVARGFATAQAAGAAEQIQIQVPNEKVGLIIGRGGETIKSLQTRSGARIQLIPQHLPDGDESKERTVRVSGDRKQIEVAKELMNEVMSQTVRGSSLSTGYNQQQANRSRGHGGNSQWGSRGPHPVQPTGYDYQHRGSYASHQNSQYPPPNYGNYPQHNLAPRSSFGAGWEQRPPQSGGYDYYGGQGGHPTDGPPSTLRSSSIPSQGPGISPAPSMGPPHSQPNYGYGQPQGMEYGQPPYSAAPMQQSYGHGYENQAPTQHPPYGGHGSSQPVYQQAAPAQGGYGQQQQYGKPPPLYGMAMQQGHPPQSYGPPRASQPGDYQGPVASAQSYDQQQQYPYASGGPMPQSTYHTYGSQPAGDGYNQPQPAALPQQGGQPPVQGYAQGGTAAADYAAYPTSQQGYDQLAPNNAGYGYQASGPAPAYGTPSSNQAVYAQQPQAQPGYDQSGGYASVPR